MGGMQPSSVLSRTCGRDRRGHQPRDRFTEPGYLPAGSRRGLVSPRRAEQSVGTRFQSRACPPLGRACTSRALLCAA